MNEFIKYQHIERLGSDEVEGILLGDTTIFPKLDGTNASVWRSSGGELQAGSRNRQLSLENDNQGFMQYIMDNKDKYDLFFYRNPEARLYGEWLVPHTLKTYRDDAWKKFYVFDVYDLFYDGATNYEDYSPVLEYYEIDFIPAIKQIKNPTMEDLMKCVEGNTYLLKDNEGVGEGIVIKNYEFFNMYGRMTWAKIVRNEFKERNLKAHNVSKLEREVYEADIVEKLLTEEMIHKTFAKIKIDINEPWSSRHIPQLLGRVWHDFVVEESWNIVKKYKKPTIDYGKLNHFVIQKTKEVLKEIF